MSFRWTKDQARYEETWWQNDDVSNSFIEKQKLWKEWKQGNKSTEKYLEAKKKTGGTVYNAKYAEG